MRIASSLLAGLLAVASCTPRPGGSGIMAIHGMPAQASAEREQSADQQIRHALNRLAFGPRPGEEVRVREIGLDVWIARQLEPERIDDSALESRLSRLMLLTQSPAQLADAYPPPALVRARQRRADSAATSADSLEVRRAARASQRPMAELSAARVMRAASSERQLEEVMVDFWHNHFSVFAGKGFPMRYFLPAYDRDVIRPHALGRFRELLGAVARSEAMLFYLDNWQSAADSGRATLAAIRLRDGNPRRAARIAAAQRRRPRRGLNENYARELLELHTLGVDGGYTQADVIEVARAFTGWSLADPRRGGGFVFRPDLHDAEAKRVMGTTLPAGRGEEDGRRVLDLLARHPATARHIATKLARRFVSDEPPSTLVDRAAAAFTDTDGDIREVVRVIVTSPEFFAASAYRAKVKTPFELVVSTLRALDAEPDATPRTAAIVGRLGQPLWGHQAPDGWPETAEPWMNTGAILNRINFGLAAASGALPGAPRRRWPFEASLERAAPEAQVDVLIGQLLGGAASPDTREILLRGDNPLATSLANADSLSGGDETVRPEPDMSEPDDLMSRRGRFRGGRPAGAFERLVGLTLGSPEFQRR